MKRLITLFILLFPIAVFGQTSKSTTTTFSVFTDPDYSFSLTYTDKWKPNEEKPGNTRLVLLYNSGEKHAHFNINVQYNAGIKVIASEMFPDLMLNDPVAIKAIIAGLESKPEYISAKKIRVGAYAGLSVRSRIIKPEGNYALESISVLDKGYMYTMTFGTDEKDYDSLIGEFGKLLSGFKMTND